MAFHEFSGMMHQKLCHLVYSQLFALRADLEKC